MIPQPCERQWERELQELRLEAARRCGLDTYPAEWLREREEAGRKEFAEERLAWRNYLAYVDKGCADDEEGAA